MISLVLCHSGSTPGCQYWLLLPLTLSCMSSSPHHRQAVPLRGQCCWASWLCLNSQVSFDGPFHFGLKNMHLACSHISWKYNISTEIILPCYFTRSTSTSCCVWQHPLQASWFWIPAPLHLPNFSYWPLTVQVISASYINLFSVLWFSS